jgi:hypothetical protein
LTIHIFVSSVSSRLLDHAPDMGAILPHSMPTVGGRFMERFAHAASACN